MGNIVKKSVQSVSDPDSITEEINKAWVTLNKVSPYYDELYSLKEKRRKLTRNTIVFGLAMYFVLGYILCAIYIVFYFVISGKYLELLKNPFRIYSIFSTITTTGESSIIMVGLAFVSIIVSIVLACIYKKKNKKKYNLRIQELETNIGIVWDETQSCIPIDCIYPSGLSYMQKLVDTGRVSTLPDALGKLEEQEHRWTVEEQNINILNEVKRAADAAEDAAIAAGATYIHY